MTDNRTTEKLLREFVAVACECEVRDYQISEYAERIEQAWNSRAERTCRIEETYGNQYCTCCGEMVGTWDSESELCVSSNMVELWNYCPNCGARVVGRDDR